ncbi:hypothetical protein V5N11_010971 [Cardamine amara subsp. amara]|uniref:Uncharacterized protein n=1 Tax=Cardamine amara subsp. amara TaxID=228776 RepID=A0ABD0Z157_CARAN
MYFHGLPKDKVLSKKRFESYEEISKQKQNIMVTLFGQKVYCAKSESFESTNEKVNRNCLNPLMNDIDHERVECQEFHRSGSSQASDTNWFGKRNDKEIISGGSGILDLNKTPANELVSSHQCFFQDLNIPYTEETEMRSRKIGLDGFRPICLDDVIEKDNATSPASCCTAENNSRTEQEDSCEVIQTAAECLVHISAVSLDQSQEIPFKIVSRFISSSQDQNFLNKPEIGKEEPARSCDSYELHTLGIRETILEDISCVSSKIIDEFNNNKEVGVKLRRGRRRMKNFQKEILSGLVSLSRREIREDLNILEAVLRSKEYKKMQGKTRDGKCSIQRYVGRRRRTK